MAKMHITGTKIIVLLASIGIAFFGWSSALPSWADGMTTGALSGLGSAICGIILAWIGQSPIKPRQ